MDSNNNSDSSSHVPVCWHVLTYFDTERFMAWLDTENKKRLDEGDYLFEPFYPYDFLSKRKDSTTPAVTQYDFQSIIFLRGKDSDINALITSWNSQNEYKLFRYHDTNGCPATVPEREMREFFENCTRYRGYFEVCAPVSEIVSLDRVEILSGPFTGHVADVVKASHVNGKVNLQLTLQIASGLLHIKMKDVKSSQVVRIDSDFSGVIPDDFIERAQNKILSVYEHRVKDAGKKEGNKSTDKEKEADVRKLNQAFHYNLYTVESKSAHAHFRALMLICAHLRHDKYAVEQIKAEVLDLLKEMNQESPSRVATDARAYLWIALYITTGDPSYRDAAKDYVRTDNPKSQKLRKFLYLMRKGRKL